MLLRLGLRELRFLIAVASFVVDTGSRAPGFWSTGSVVVEHRLSCSVTCGIFPDLGLKQCRLHYKEDSLPPDHQGSPECTYFK